MPETSVKVVEGPGGEQMAKKGRGAEPDGTRIVRRLEGEWPGYSIGEGGDQPRREIEDMS